jgi:hypothetical protein
MWPRRLAAFFGVLLVEVRLHVVEHVAVRVLALRVGDVLVESSA